MFAGIGALTLETQAVPGRGAMVARLTPSGALTEALTQALTPSVDWFGIAVLAVWGAIGARRAALVQIHPTPSTLSGSVQSPVRQNTEWISPGRP